MSMRKYISVKIRRAVEERADYCCEYCRLSDSYSPSTFHLEHIISLARGGDDTLENLAYACSGCNEFKVAKITATDPATGQQIPLFHPRKDQWNKHFKWDDEALHIIGISLKGKLTIQALNMNRQGLINLRQVLKNAGLHPPV